MKKLLFFLLLGFLVSACENDNVLLLGKWTKNNFENKNEKFVITFFSKSVFSMNYSNKKINIQNDGNWKWNKKANTIELEFTTHSKIDKYTIKKLNADSLVWVLINETSSRKNSQSIFLKES